MTTRFVNPRPQYLDTSGDPLPSAKLYFYENGTLTDKDTYADINETILNANPLPLNADGTVPNCFYPGTARVILTFDDGTGEQQRWDIDGVGGFGSGAAFEDWSSIVEYNDGDIVEGSDGEYYRSIQNNNTGNDPTTEDAFWEQISFLRTWNENITYNLGDGGVVGSDGKIYRSLQNSNLNNDPTSTSGFWDINNPFNQDLNTTDSPTFDALTLTGIADLSAAGAYFGTAAAANLLDDYEEGIFTPVFADASSGGNEATVTTATGVYTKVGRLVTVDIVLVNIDTTGLTAGNVAYITGLPFTSSSLGLGSCRLDKITFTGAFVSAEIDASATWVQLDQTTSGAADSSLLVSAVDGTGSDINVTITYHA